MKLVTFNVNGIRAIRDYYVAIGSSFDGFLDALDGDVICLQEHKSNDKNKLDHEILSPANFTAHYAFPERPRSIGYSGVATFIKRELRVRHKEIGITGIYNPEGALFEESTAPLTQKYSPEILFELDGEARCLILNFERFILLNVYFPNDAGPERSEFRMQFYEVVRERCLEFLKLGLSVMIVGDINTTAFPVDHCDYVHQWNQWEHPDRNACIKAYIIHGEIPNNLPSFIPEFYASDGRRWLYRLLTEDGFKDVYRELHTDTRFPFTCWNIKLSARGTNYGTRIDAIICAGPLWNFSGIFKACDIRPDFMGSDHCPVYVELDDEVLRNAPIPAISSNHKPLKRKGDAEMRQTRLANYFGIPDKKPAFALSKKSADLKTETLTTIPDTIADDGPVCWHGDRCKVHQVRKAGPNRGRSFYACPRATMGQEPPYSINKDGRLITQYQCSFFEWY